MTMYERLMMLPVFKGIGESQLSAFIEKTNLEFGTVPPGETVVSKGEVCDHLICVLSGSIMSTYSLFSGAITLKAVYGAGKVVGLTRLYGMDNTFGHSIHALEECGTMRFSKTQYMDMLRESPICLINFLNTLSYRSQMMENALTDLYSDNLAGRLATIVSVLTERDCIGVTIKGIRRICFREDADCDLMDIKEMRILAERGLIEIKGDDEIRIASRNDLMDFAEEVKGEIVG